MKEPISVRVTDSTDPCRGVKFQAVLEKRNAIASHVIRGLIDAYIECDGNVAWPVRLHDWHAEDIVNTTVRFTGLSRPEAVQALRGAFWEMIERCGGFAWPIAVLPAAAVDDGCVRRAKKIVALAVPRTLDG